MLLRKDEWNDNIELMFSDENIFRLIYVLSVSPLQRAFIMASSFPVGAHRGRFCKI